MLTLIRAGLYTSVQDAVALACASLARAIVARWTD